MSQPFLRQLDKKLWTAVDPRERGHPARSYKITSTSNLIDDVLGARASRASTVAPPVALSLPNPTKPPPQRRRTRMERSNIDDPKKRRPKGPRGGASQIQERLQQALYPAPDRSDEPWGSSTSSPPCRSSMRTCRRRNSRSHLRILPRPVRPSGGGKRRSLERSDKDFTTGKPNGLARESQSILHAQVQCLSSRK